MAKAAVVPLVIDIKKTHNHLWVHYPTTADVLVIHTCTFRVHW